MKVFLFLYLTTAFTVCIFACDCYPVGNPLQALLESHAVFIGTVKSMDIIFHEAPTYEWVYRVTFRVLGYWKGVTSPDIELFTRTHVVSCGYPFVIGTTYLVYAYMSSGELFTGMCTRTRDVIYAGEDIKMLGEPEIFILVDERNPHLDVNIPTTYSLFHNYPNPFNPSTQITYSVLKATGVTLKIYEILGREIATLVNERKQAGEYKVTWNAEGVPSGVYFYRIAAGEFTQMRKMVMIR